MPLAVVKRLTPSYPKVALIVSGFESDIEIKEVALKTLLYSDSIDWEHYLSSLETCLNYRVLEDGELIQDRDIWLKANNAIEGIFKYLKLYEAAEGDDSIIQYYTVKQMSMEHLLT